MRKPAPARRSYVLDKKRINDHATGKKTNETQRVLDGDLDLLK